MLVDGVPGSASQAGCLGGGDRAEFYDSDETLESGAVVSVDGTASDSVERSSDPYQRNLLGVVATRPGIILGSGHETTYPIALVGRVPVNVTTENGIIKAGDRVTSATLDGYGMRATQTGRVLGVALEDMVLPEDNFCPDDPQGQTDKRCGQVMVFVNLVDYNGASLAVMMEEAREGLTLGNEEEPTTISSCVDVEGNATSTDAIGACEQGYVLVETEVESSGLTVETDGEQEILAFLTGIKDSHEEEGVQSEIFTDRLAASFDIYTPRIIAEGLRVDRISALNESILFENDVVFFGTPYFTTDTAGFAVVKEGATEVTVVFEREYIEKPIVNANMATSDGISSTGAQSAAAIQALFGNDVRFLITNATTTGFTIILNKPAPEDIHFNWIALMVKDARTVESATSTPVVDLPVEPVPDQMPVPDPIPQPTPDPAPEPPPEGTSEPEPIPEPPPEETITPDPTASESAPEPTPEVAPEPVT